MTEHRLLVKLRPSSALAAAESRHRLRPLFEARSEVGFAAGSEPRWYAADLPDGAATPWDLAHTRVADQLGIAASDVLFVEPDIVHDLYQDPHEPPLDTPFAVGENCGPIPQDPLRGKAVGPADGWHLGPEFSGLGDAREAVTFAHPRTRVAHLDTGYYPDHVATPRYVLHELGRNFVPRDADRDSAEDPDNRIFLGDASGHGTGTLSILAGGAIPHLGDLVIGGAPDAEVLPLRIADRVILLRTSQFAQALEYAIAYQADVVTMSMGGLPSRLWREAVDHAYMAGICIVAASGNNFKGLVGRFPTRHVVYPARYRRVIAACGVMANHDPYHDLTGKGTFEGNYGPASVMDSALGAYTPNIPWAVFGCRDRVRLNGEGTSSATPQVAAAAALWYEKYKHELPRDWQRVEAVRNALFSSARKVHPREVGQGILNAAAALAVRPVLGLPQTRSDGDSFAFLRVLTGLGIDGAAPREEMFDLELAQRWLVNADLQELVEDPDQTTRLDRETLAKVMEVVIEDEGASLALRRHVKARYPAVAGSPRPPSSTAIDPAASVADAVCDAQPEIPTPGHRRLRVFAIDPSLSGRLETAGINDVALEVPWEPLEGRGPVGGYVAVVDTEGSGTPDRQVDLNDPRLLAQDGWAPSEGNPQFHQQMVYAVAMKTIVHFERALGRPIFWRPRTDPEKPDGAGDFVERLTIRPHALRQANAYYSPREVALLFGYFEATPDSPADLVPGSRVYTCLSHDIVAHETAHAVLDGMQRRFNEPTNPDVLALHEGFADIVALMQHFTMTEVLENEIARTRGNIEAESLLGSLAVQLGQGTGRKGALREAIGMLEGGVWKRLPSEPAEYRKRLMPHSRGAVLVAAVFDAFIAIYKTRTADLLRLYTGGTGVLPQGEIHPDLVRLLAAAASKSAGHVLTMCIRALDYLPPVDVTFFEYLRALITADFDLVRDDRLNYRVAFVEAFRRRGIYPVNLGTATSDTPRTLSVDTLRWRGLELVGTAKGAEKKVAAEYTAIVEALKRYADVCLYTHDRGALFEATRKQASELRAHLGLAFEAVPGFAKELGINRAHDFEVHELRSALRLTPSGRPAPQIIVSLTQTVEIPADGTGTPAYTFRGGSTLVIDLSVPAVKYRIVKNIDSEARRARTAEFVREAAEDPLRALFLAPDRLEPFAALHLIGG